jgi:AraC-like DNA-binding protein
MGLTNVNRELGLVKDLVDKSRETLGDVAAAQLESTLVKYVVVFLVAQIEKELRDIAALRTRSVRDTYIKTLFDWALEHSLLRQIRINDISGFLGIMDESLKDGLQKELGKNNQIEFSYTALVNGRHAIAHVSSKYEVPDMTISDVEQHYWEAVKILAILAKILDVKWRAPEKPPGKVPPG